jgi:hypothetical protein
VLRGALRVVWQPSLCSRRRPFHPVKLSRVIKQLPVSVNDALQIGEEKGEGSAEAAADNSEAASATGEADASSLQRVIRSKGFSWLATYHTAALYWCELLPIRTVMI